MHGMGAENLREIRKVQDFFVEGPGPGQNRPMSENFPGKTWKCVFLKGFKNIFVFECLNFIKMYYFVKNVNFIFHGNDGIKVFSTMQCL
jgi:hypothetical protein